MSLRNLPFYLKKAREEHKAPVASLEGTAYSPKPLAGTFADSSSSPAAAAPGTAPPEAEEARQRKFALAVAFGSLGFQSSQLAEAKASGLAS